MNANLTITNVGNIFEGEFNPGILPKKTSGRRTSCFVYFMYGKTEYRFENYSFNASPKCFIYLAKGGIYEMEIFEKSRFICVDFDFSADFGKSRAFECSPPCAKNLFQKILHTENTQNPLRLPLIFSYAYEIYFEAVKSENKPYAKKSPLLADITAYISSHYRETDFGIEAVARRFELSEVHLRRIFKSAGLNSPIKYVNNLKTETAKNMLRISNYTIAETARYSGFEDPYYFSRFFKKETGMSPSEYRKLSKCSER